MRRAKIALRMIWAVGLHVCPPVHLPGLLVPTRLVSHAPCRAPSPLAGARSMSATRPLARPCQPRPVAIFTILLLYTDTDRLP